MNFESLKLKVWSFRPKSKRDYAIYSILLLILVVAYQFTGKSDEVTVTTAVTPFVEVMSLADLQEQSVFSTLGTVESISEANLKAESGGRVVTLNTDIGKFVPAGFVLATFENSRERAALIQAQGSYDAAIAGAASGNSSVKAAELAVEAANTALTTTLRNSQTSLASIVNATIDQFFANPNSYFPGLRVGADAEFLNSARISLQTSLPQLQTDVTTLSDNHAAVSANVIQVANQIISMIDEILSTVEKDGDTDMLGGVALSTYAPGLYSARSSLTSLIASVEGAEQNLSSAKETLSRAQLAGTDTTVSLANAQIKIALGSLRSAQASYEKTLVRTPIAGTINALYIKRGDYVSPLSDVAVVANNGGLQVLAAVSEEDRVRIAIGDLVNFENEATGTVTAIAGAADPKTGKVAVKMSVTDTTTLTAGTAVTVKFVTTKSDTKRSDQVTTLPLTAIKLTATSAYVFTVSKENLLEAHEVTLGRVLGDTIVIQSGVTETMQIVKDARGLKTGDKVTTAK